MNQKQKKFLRLCGAVLCTILAFPPYWIEVPSDLYDGLEYAPLWNPPSGERAESWGGHVTIATELLGLEILVLCIIALCGLLKWMDAPKVAKNLFHG